MKSLFDDATAVSFRNDPLAMRVYTSQLLGRDKNLVLHGGGNTSVKIGTTLYVKGSGWNLDTIEKPGFSPVDLGALCAMAGRERLSDAQMVKEQREAMSDQSAPNPSIEAILHAIIPFAYVDHTHADAVATLTNTPEGKKLVQALYGPDMLVIDYVMPGFELAKHIYNLTRTIDWNTLKGMVLMHHGVFTFDDDAKRAYEKMIDIVTVAEEYLKARVSLPSTECARKADSALLSTLTEETSSLRGTDITAVLLDSPQALTLSRLPNLKNIIRNGELTPEHVIRIKPFPVLIREDVSAGMAEFVRDYRDYFDAHASGEHICLDLAPRYAIIEGLGAVALGKDAQEAAVIADIVEHTITAILSAEQLGGWGSLTLAQMFDMEYWELEQAKLKK
ncbi:MAG: hypothetical protein JU82_01960 [Sulfuricurvum sp. MLSB]|uniref:class II aldolase/adducin family protein n=1 Tax=unclassified Sulfuricurvum TaxID=2632390 RepID=UPI0005051AAC|nr:MULTISPECIES: class II aldolase/adducin family protein [unclassified Sulfuricurvum]KFN40656.1 MAG: hypothetical protein JU82_01960 [Sulfuricurvum sp. MLSB]